MGDRHFHSKRNHWSGDALVRAYVGLDLEKGRVINRGGKKSRACVGERRWKRVKKGLPGNCEAGAVTWLDLNFKCKRAQRSLRCRLPRCRSPPAPHRRGKTRGSAVLTPGLLFFSFLFFSWCFSSGRVRGNGYLHWYLGTYPYDLPKITPVFRGSVGTAQNTRRVSGQFIGLTIMVLKKSIPGSDTQSWLLKKKKIQIPAACDIPSRLSFFWTSNHCPEGYIHIHENRRFCEGFEVTATRWFFDSLIFFFAKYLTPFVVLCVWFFFKYLEWTILWF